jgi:hypothetical protein
VEDLVVFIFLYIFIWTTGYWGFDLIWTEMARVGCTNWLIFRSLQRMHLLPSTAKIARIKNLKTHIQFVTVSLLLKAAIIKAI